MAEVATLPENATMATGDTLLDKLINVPLKSITGAETELFDKTDLIIGMGYGAVAGAALQGFRANKRIEEAARTGKAERFKYLLV